MLSYVILIFPTCLVLIAKASLLLSNFSHLDINSCYNLIEAKQILSLSVIYIVGVWCGRVRAGPGLPGRQVRLPRLCPGAPASRRGQEQVKEIPMAYSGREGIYST